MTRITFISHDGDETLVDAKDGVSVMENAVRNDVPGIDGECGGACACATCHVHIDDAWIDRVGVADAMERNMLEFADDVRTTSRLSCQIAVTPGLAGLVVRTPEQQHSQM